MVVYDNEFETKENKIYTKDKIEPQFQYGEVGGGVEGMGGGRGGENNVVVPKKKRILICFDSATQRVQPTVPTFFLLSDTDQSNNTKIMRAGNNNDSITIINNYNKHNIYDNNRSNCIT